MDESTSPISYPVRLDPDDDPRFNAGLLRDVVKALEAAGYPPVTSGLDLVRLQSALYGFIYGGES